MKNHYHNGWSAQFPIRDGHDWGQCEGQARHWDGAQCKDCGVIATNTQISTGAKGTCPVPGEEGTGCDCQH